MHKNSEPLDLLWQRRIQAASLQQRSAPERMPTLEHRAVPRLPPSSELVHGRPVVTGAPSTTGFALPRQGARGLILTEAAQRPPLKAFVKQPLLPAGLQLPGAVARAVASSPAPATRPQASLQGLGDIFSDIGAQLRPENLVASVALDTTLYDFSAPFPLRPQAQPSNTSMLLRFLKPKITIQLSDVYGYKVAPIVVAPYGLPTDEKAAQAMFTAGFAGVAGLALYGAYKLFISKT